MALTLGGIDQVTCGSSFRQIALYSCAGSRFYGPSLILKSQKIPVDQHVLASNLKKSIRRIGAFIEKQSFATSFPDLMISRNRRPNFVRRDLSHVQTYAKCTDPQKVLVILNPHSGHRHSREVFHTHVLPILKLAGFTMEVIETKFAGHAKVLASTVDFSRCPDGIICVGGDGIVNEVINGLLTREDLEEAISLPIGVIPSGSDNSLVWSVLGVRDPITAANAIAKGGCTCIDVFAVKWIKAGVSQFGVTASYFGFVSDVLELSEKYRLQFGPLRYLVAGFLKFLSFPQYNFEVEYLPLAPERAQDGRRSDDDFSIAQPRTDSAKFIYHHDSHEELLSFESRKLAVNLEVINLQTQLLASTDEQNKSGSKADRSWSSTNNSRCSSESFDASLMQTSELKSIGVQNCEFGPGREAESTTHVLEESKVKWVAMKGHFVGILICNHPCRSAQSLRSQVVAPEAEHDDNNLDLILVHGSGRLRLLIFFVALQFGWHTLLPFVEYVKVKSVKIRSIDNSNSGCGVDGEIFHGSGEAICSLIPEQCKLLGKARDHT